VLENTLEVKDMRTIDWRRWATEKGLLTRDES
jgi:hypothetical protein